MSTTSLGTDRDRWTPRVLSVLRVVTALLFFEHGTQKLLGIPPSASSAHLKLLSVAGAAGMLELIGGLLLLIGLFTRPVAFVLSGEMAFAYFISHAPRGLFPSLNGGDAAILFCFVFLFLSFAGGGEFSADWLLRGRRE